MIRPGDAIYSDKNFRLFSRRSKNRIFFGWNYDTRTMEEGIRLHVGANVITDKNGFGIACTRGEDDFKILLP